MSIKHKVEDNGILFFHEHYDGAGLYIPASDLINFQQLLKEALFDFCSKNKCQLGEVTGRKE